jgi:Asp-tRNA(Asn)/Glu-tRNA(Gln) amidotransferase B subunit
VLSAYAQVVEPQENVLHDLVKALLKETRSEEEDAQLRAVEALRRLWDSGIEASLAAYSAESMPFLVETLETGGVVQKATKELLARMNEQTEASDSESGSEDGSDDDVDEEDD